VEEEGLTPIVNDVIEPSTETAQASDATPQLPIQPICRCGMRYDALDEIIALHPILVSRAFGEMCEGSRTERGVLSSPEIL